MVDQRNSYIPDYSEEHGIGRILEIGGSQPLHLMHVNIKYNYSWMLCNETLR